MVHYVTAPNLDNALLLQASGDVYPIAYDHAKLKAVFEKALPPLTDSSSLAIR